MFLAKDGGQLSKPLEWAVRASGMPRPVQGVGVGVWGWGWLAEVTEEKREREEEEKWKGKGKVGEKGWVEGKARFLSLRNHSLVGEAREPRDD